MKTIRQSSMIGVSGTTDRQKTSMFSNHGGLSSSIVAKYTGNNRFTTLNKSNRRSQSRSPSNLRSPKEDRNISLYKRHSKAAVVRTRTPTLGNVAKLVHSSSFVKNDKPRRIQRDRKSIRTKRHEFHSKPEIVRNSSPSKSSRSSPKKSKSPKERISMQKVQSPFFNTKSDKK